MENKTVNTKCIWCNSQLNHLNTKNKSHTIPKSLGGKKTYKLECDECNSFFGDSIKDKNYSIESCFTSAFGIIKYHLLSDNIKAHIKKPQSTFFKYIENKGVWKVDFKDVVRKSTFFSDTFGNYFKRSFYKIITSCFSSDYNNIYNSFDMNFISDFCKKNEGDLKLFCWKKPLFIALYSQKRQIENAEFIHVNYNHLYEDDNIIEIEYLTIIFILHKRKLNETELNISLMASKFNKFNNNTLQLFNRAEIVEIKNMKDLWNAYSFSL